MGRKRIYDIPDLAGRLFDLMVAAPEGMDVHQMTAALGVPQRVTRKVIRELRLTLAEKEPIALPVRTEGRRWVYALNGDASRGSTVRKWSRERAEKAVANLDIDVATWTALAAGADGRTGDGKAARYVARSMTRIQEDVKELFAGEDAA